MIKGKGLKIQKGGSSSEPASGILFQVVSTTEGSIPAPVMTTAQRLALGTIVVGLQVFDSNLNKLCVAIGTNAGSESNWLKLIGGSLTGSYNINASLNGTTVYTYTTTVTGATVGQRVVLNPNANAITDLNTAGAWFVDLQSWVSASDTVSIRVVISTYTTFGATSGFNISVN